MDTWPKNWREAVQFLLLDTKLVRVTNEDSILDMLSYIHQLGYDGPVVVQIQGKPTLTKSEFLSQYSHAIGHIREVLQASV